MAAGLIILPQHMPARDVDGAPLAGAKMYFYADQSTTLAPTYTSSSLTIANANPIVADALGTFPQAWANQVSVFTVVVTDASGVPVSTGSYSGVSPAIDATLASVTLSDAARAAAVVAQLAAQSAQAAAAASAASAAGDVTAAAGYAATAAAAAAEAQAIAGFNPALYQQVSAKGAANGYAGLDAASKVPMAQLPGGLASLHSAVSGDIHSEILKLATTADAALAGIYADDAGDVGFVNSAGATRLTIAADGTMTVYSDAGASSAVATEDFAIAVATAL